MTICLFVVKDVILFHRVNFKNSIVTSGEIKFHLTHKQTNIPYLNKTMQIVQSKVIMY
jgi:hypothetical protein